MRQFWILIFALLINGIWPVIGGMLNDSIAPAATWLAGLSFGLLSAAGFVWMAPRLSAPVVANTGRHAPTEYAEHAE